MTDEARRTRRGGLAELAEDAVGFGGQELRLTRYLVLRPRAVMDAYDAHGPMAGGLYPKPLRYYLTLMGLYLLCIGLLGGFERLRTPQQNEMFAEFAAGTGKSVEEFSNDFEQWYSLLTIPITALFIGGAAFLLIRRWSAGGDRQDFNQTFTFLNAFSVLTIPLGLIGLANVALTFWTMPVMYALLLATYARVGAGRWWRTRKGAWGKGALLLLVNILALLPAGLLMFGLSVLAARLLP